MPVAVLRLSDSAVRSQWSPLRRRRYARTADRPCLSSSSRVCHSISRRISLPCVRCTCSDDRRESWWSPDRAPENRRTRCRRSVRLCRCSSWANWTFWPASTLRPASSPPGKPSSAYASDRRSDWVHSQSRWPWRVWKGVVVSNQCGYNH